METDQPNTTVKRTLRFREIGERGMILEQLFLGTAFGQPTRSEWRPVPVVPQSEGVQE